jgi:hypothetical protein
MIFKIKIKQIFCHESHMFICAQTKDFDLEDGGGPLKILSRTTGGLRTVSL